MALLKLSTAYTRAFLLIDSADHVSGKTGVTPTVTLSKAGGAFGAAGGTVTEIANGFYKIAYTTTDSNTLGDLAVHVTGTGCDATDFVDQVVAVDLADAVRFGLSALPNAAAEASGGLYTRGTGAGQINQPANGLIDVNTLRWNGTAVATPATAGVPDVNVKNINNVAATSVTTINANVGTTQPVNYTGTGASALVKGDMVDVAGSAVSTSTAQIGVNAVNIGGTAQTGRDVGASVLLSSGTGTGQLDFTSGVVKANLAQILATVLTETTGGFLAAAFKKFFDKASPTGTINSIPDAVAGASGGLVIAGSNATITANITGNLSGSVGSVSGAVGSVTGAVGSVTGSVGSIATGGIAAASFAAGAIDNAAIATDAIGSAEIAASAVTEIQAGLSTYAGGDTSGVTTLLARLTSARAGFLDFLTGDTFARLGAPVGASISADIAGVQSDTDNIQTRLPATLVSGRIDASVGAMATDTLTSAALAASAVTEIQTGLSTLDASGVRTAVGLASANLDTQLTTIDDFLDTEITAIKAKTDNLPAAPAAVGDIPTANANADALLDRTAGVEANRTVRQALRIMLSALGGKLSGAATSTVTTRDTNDSKDRIVATVDSDGNRSAVTYDAS